LQGEPKVEFEERWGLNPEFYQSDSERAITSLQLLPEAPVVNRRGEERCADSRKDAMSRAIEATTKESKGMISRLKIVPEAQVGFEIMHVLIIDLLG
jgi:hypothetical protein